MEKKPTINQSLLFLGLFGALIIGLLGLLLEIVTQVESAKIWGTCLAGYMAWWIFFVPVLLVLGYYNTKGG